MFPLVTCRCTLCCLEPRLLSALSSVATDAIDRLFLTSGSLHQCSSVPALLSHLKATADRGSDDSIGELLTARTLNPTFVESVLVLAFLPTLHTTVRRVGRQQPALSPDDIAQQALSVLLQYLRSEELHARRSHFAFAIARAVKRKTFRWAQRESRGNGISAQRDEAAFNEMPGNDSFERHLLLGHFLHHCIAKRLITDSELNLLVRFKLNGGSLETVNGSNGNSSNAVRQKLKRLLRKLRRLARERSSPSQVCRSSEPGHRNELRRAEDRTGCVATCQAPCHPPQSRNLDAVLSFDDSPRFGSGLWVKEPNLTHRKDKNMKTEEIKQLTDRATEQLIEALEQGRSETLTRYLAAMARFRRYSLRNVMLIASQNPQATQVAGFHTWHALGRFVKKGEKGILILAPMIRRKIGCSREDETEESSNPAGFRLVYVFDIRQTDGQELPKFCGINGNPREYSERLADFVGRHGISIEYSANIAPALGSSAGGRITLLPDQSAAEQFVTLAHELAHELMHRAERRSATSKRVRETEAEAVAFVVSQAIGLEMGSTAADYIQLYDGDAKLLTESLQFIQQTANLILEGIGAGAESSSPAY
jgi:N-terminal domain of anti-restriction factor ArdC